VEPVHLPERTVLWTEAKPQGVNHFFLNQMDRKRAADPLEYMHMLLVLLAHFDTGKKSGICVRQPLFHWRVNGELKFSSCLRFEMIMCATRAAHVCMQDDDARTHTRAAAIFVHVVLPHLNAWRTRQHDILPWVAHPFGAAAGLCLALITRQMDTFRAWEADGRMDDEGLKWLKWMTTQCKRLLAFSGRLLGTTVASLRHIVRIGDVYGVSPDAVHGDVEKARVYFELRGDDVRKPCAQRAHEGLTTGETKIDAEVHPLLKQQLLRPYRFRNLAELQKNIEWIP
jgi:hypothetical protein